MENWMSSSNNFFFSLVVISVLHHSIILCDFWGFYYVGRVKTIFFFDCLICVCVAFGLFFIHLSLSHAHTLCVYLCQLFVINDCFRLSIRNCLYLLYVDQFPICIIKIILLPLANRFHGFIPKKFAIHTYTCIRVWTREQKKKKQTHSNFI